ncbi:hypothetical protein B6N60_03275 [Richelia sinica FACHB-800]|uniref:Uncharacterized protein n=1 Tax=Richelia sinica FACHB-800 TaxID=1357546 RepID=A0A975Y5T4_9NOST|nr:hypothetical protein B6N60_03275 [Richelia sinica FACHB-800]
MSDLGIETSAYITLFRLINRSIPNSVTKTPSPFCEPVILDLLDAVNQFILAIP